jgi:anti-anti-sigma factor
VPGPPAQQALLDVLLTGPRPGVVVLGVGGEVDLATAPRLESGIELAFDPPARHVVLDLSRVTFLASRGLAVLLDAHRRAAEHDVRLEVVVGRPPVRRMLEISGLITVLRCHATLADALDAV